MPITSPEDSESNFQERSIRSAEEAALVETVIRPVSGWQPLNLAELWKHRELLWLLTIRDVKIRYKQTILGVAWTVLQPTLMMIVLTVFLGGLLGTSSEDPPYPIFLYTGLLPWTFFASATSKAANSVVNSEGIVRRVYIPRLMFPLAAVTSSLIDLVIAFSMLIVLMVFYGIVPGWSILWLMVFIPLLTCAALGLGTLLGALNVAYRDFRHVVAFLMQLGLFATPAIYSRPPEPNETPVQASVVEVAADAIEEKAEPKPSREILAKIGLNKQGLLKLNPMNALIVGFRAAVLGQPMRWSMLPSSAGMVLVLFVVGCYYFRRVEDTFADVI